MGARNGTGRRIPADGARLRSVVQGGQTGRSPRGSHYRKTPRRILPLAEPVKRTHGASIEVEERTGRCASRTESSLQTRGFEARGLLIALGPQSPEIWHRRLQRRVRRDASRGVDQLRSDL